jgi:hypothetical protein
MDRTGDSTSVHDPGLLAAYVEGRLDDEERRAVTEHLGVCADCRQVLAMLARAPGVLPTAAGRRPMAAPVWLAIAATVILATLAVRRVNGPVAPAVDRGPASTVAATVGPSPAPPAPAPADPGPRATLPADDPLRDPALLVKRGAAPRQVGGKTFRLRAGEWVDVAFQSTSSLPTVRVTGPGERAAIVQRVPALAPYAALGDRVVVVFQGTVYRFAP